MNDLKRIIKGYRPRSDKRYYWVLRDTLLLLYIIKRNIVRFSYNCITIILSKMKNIDFFPPTETIGDDD
jgi:hypothetical protein